MRTKSDPGNVSRENDQNEEATSPYELTIDLQVLKHLGIGLYSNVPAVVSEMVANAYDADATKVEITIKDEEIVIEDDGSRMNVDDANKKFLTVGYDKRNLEEPVTPKYRRKPMGRKGIGKLSAFAIAGEVEVRSIKTDLKTGEELGRAAFIMDVAKIEEKAKDKKLYHPKSLDDSDTDITKGTRIALRGLKRTRNIKADYVRVNLARRFSVFGKKFRVYINGNEVTPADRQYWDKLQFVWGLGNSASYERARKGKKVRKSEVLPKVLTIPGQADETVSGWIGTVHFPKELKDGYIDNNGIVVMARGKLVHENLLPFARTSRIFAEYVVGEINADWLDEDLEEDIATSGRQSLKEDDPRFSALQNYAKERLEQVADKWTDWRKEVGVKDVVKRHPVLQKWLDEMTPDNRKRAEKLISTIEGMPIAGEDDKKVLLQHGIMAFETLALKGNLDALSEMTQHGPEGLKGIFKSVEDLEAAHYSQIVKARLGVLEALEKGVDQKEHEKVLQEHIYKNPWLIDASWERATEDARFEKRFVTQSQSAKFRLSRDQALSRYDIKFLSISGKVLILELKKSDRLLTIRDILDQGTKYSDLAELALRDESPEEIPYYEIIFLLGRLPVDYVNAQRRYEDTLRPQHIRIMTYEQLIKHARQSYRDYLERRAVIERIQKMVDNL
ncbi:MAG: ATP-binding protein [Blastocatellia bacterium]|nr:ATP-binding protein [Blastocatellia bacterium]